jgi:hypothetical protein
MTTSRLGTGQAYVVGRFGDIQTSTDGITWTARTSAGGTSYQKMTYGNGNYAFHMANNNTQIQQSTDGITWTLRTITGFESGTGFSGLTYTNNLFWAWQGTRVSTSTNAITWSASKLLFPDTDVRNIADNGTTRLAYINGSGSANLKFHSPSTSFYTLYGSAGTTILN